MLTEHIASWRASEASETLSGGYKLQLVRYLVIPWVLGVYQNKMPMSRGCSPRVRAFCSDITRINHGITILYPSAVLQPAKMSDSIENNDVLVKTVSKAGMCEFVEYVPDDRNDTNNSLPLHWLGDTDKEDEAFIKSTIEDGGDAVSPTSPYKDVLTPTVVVHKRFSKITSEEETAAMSKGIQIPNTEKTTNWSVKIFNE